MKAHHKLLAGCALIATSALGLSGCASSSAEGQALDDIAARVSEIQSGFRGAITASGPGTEYELDQYFATDLRGLTESEKRLLGWPLTGYFNSEQTPERVAFDFIVQGVGNEGGLSNANRSYYACVRYEWEPGTAEVRLLDQSCPDSVLEKFSVWGESATLSQLPL